MLVERLEWFMEIGDRKVREGGAIATCECECAPLTVFTKCGNTVLYCFLPKNRVRHVFRQWDANDDGSLDLNEFKVRL